MDSIYTYAITDAAGVLAFSAVVADNAVAGQKACKKPGAALAPSFVGVTQEAQATQYKGVAVKTDGRTFVRATAVAIAAGDRVAIGDNTGRVYSVEAGMIDYDAVGTDAQVIEVVGIAVTAALGTIDELIEIDIRPYTVH